MMPLVTGFPFLAVPTLLPTQLPPVLSSNHPMPAEQRRAAGPHC